MKPHFKILIIAEKASDLREKALELASQFESVALKTSVEASVQAMGKEQEEIIEQKTPETIPAGLNRVFPVNIPAGGFNTDVIANEDQADVAAPDKDSRGIPWDARIHLSNKKQKADGTWMYKRGLDENVKVKVESELLSGHISAPPAPVAQAPAVHPAIAARNERLSVVKDTSVAPPQVAPAMPAPSMPSPGLNLNLPLSFESFKAQLPAVIAALLRANIPGFDQAYTLSLAQHFGVANLWEVSKMDDHAGVLYSEFLKLGFIKG